MLFVVYMYYGNFKRYKVLLLIPLSILLLSIFLFFSLDEVKKDIDLTGGSSVVVSGNVDERVKDILSDFEVKDVRKTKNLWEIVYQKDIEVEKLIERLKESGYEIEYIGSKKISPVLGEKFYEQMIRAIFIAFMFMSIVVFFIFKNPLPSFYVLFAVVSDIFETFVFSQALGIPLSLYTISALLLLIGYSADSDILLTTRVLRGRGELSERFESAFKTGITMSLTTLAVLVPIILISASEVLVRIATVLFIGITIDIINTWCANGVMLRLWIERRKNEG